MLENTLVLLKPDAVRRALIGEIISRLERTGLKIIAMKMVKPTPQLAGEHYSYDDIAVRHGEDVRNRLIKFITSDPVVAMVVEGVSAVEVVRKLAGSTEPKSALPGTIRGDFCHHTFALSTEKEESIRNVIHASASVEEAEKEIGLWFNSDEVTEYKRSDQVEHFF
ncbi:nucleoside-diphosphate kinase [Spirochaeta cellobiosiphila]|uniref:nucleoside-diphosphate kinase n=1 Tax=Spirochaeta cellobiosiphila TaxID=504483 RepID=UPI00041F6EA9|nr:nucleoside-diphosphate kinase [Spirochaeta cellobiosiphila]